MALLFVGTTGCGEVEDLECRITESGNVACRPQESPTPTPVLPEESSPTPTPERDEGILVRNPVCRERMGTDGPGGFLWKASSESTGDLVILLPGKFQSQFETVEVKRKRGGVEQLFFTGFSNYDQDGERQTWRATQPGRAYDGRVEARGGDPDQTCVWIVSRPAQRQD